MAKLMERRARPRPPGIRIAILSKDCLLCAGLLRIVASEPSLRFVGQADRITRLSGLRDLRPEVLLVDSRMDGVLELCVALRRESGPAIIFFMAARDDDEFAMMALEAGARGILSTSAQPEQLVKAVRVVREGDVWARRQVMAARIEQLAGARAERRTDAALLELPLSLREREVLRYAATGMSNRELAERLAIGEATVKAHMTSIFQKLGLRGRAQLAAAYYGMISTGVRGPIRATIRPDRSIIRRGERGATGVEQPSDEGGIR